MALTKKQIERFARLHVALAEFARVELKMPLPSKSKKGGQGGDGVDTLVAIRDSLHAKPKLIDKFVRKNPASLSEDDLEIVAQWKRAVTGGFFVLEHKARHSLFMGVDKDFVPRNEVYAVSALTDPLAEVIGGRLPVYVQTVLLPFEGKIVFDGLLLSSPVDLGEEVRQVLKECLKCVKITTGIITTLEADAPPRSQRRKR